MYKKIASSRDFPKDVHSTFQKKSFLKMPDYQTGVLWALTQSGSPIFLVLAPLLWKRRREFYEGCRNKNSIAKEMPK